MKENQEAFLEKLFRYPWLIVFVIGIITAFFAVQLPRAELDNNNLRFVPKDDKALEINNYIDETFGSSLFILVTEQATYSMVSLLVIDLYAIFHTRQLMSTVTQQATSTHSLLEGEVS